MKTVLFCSVFKTIPVHTNRFRIVFARPHYNAYRYWKRCLTLYSLIISLSILSPLLSSRQIKVVPLRWSSSWSFPEPSRFWRTSTESFLSSSFRCPKTIRSFMIFCYLLQGSYAFRNSKIQGFPGLFCRFFQGFSRVLGSPEWKQHSQRIVIT